jgi:hypothetical protein
MGAAVLLIATDQMRVLGFEKEHLGLDALTLELIDRRRQWFEGIPDPAVDHYCQLSPTLGDFVVGNGLSDELGREVVDDREPEVLEYLGGARAAGSRHPGHHQDLGSGGRTYFLVGFDHS